MNTKILYVAACAVFLSFAAQAQDNATTASPNSDNTAVNTRDRNADERTADQANNNLSDRKIMQKIRKAVIADKSLSTYAHNIKIISKHGKVTLKGPVQSNEERQSIEAKATSVVGAKNVTNQISVPTKYR